MLGVVSFVVYAAIGLSITSNLRYQGFHDRLAGGTYVAPRVIKARTSPSLSYDLAMGVDGVAVTSAEAAQYPAAGSGRTPRCRAR